MPTQPTNHGQNTGLIVIVVGIFMVIIAFVAVTYLQNHNADVITSNQTKNSKQSATERANLTQITCALWASVGSEKKVDPDMVAKVKAVCDSDS